MDHLTGSRVLITGGAGLVGSHIADQLVKEKVDEIIIFDNFQRGWEKNLSWALEHGVVKIIRGDICDRNLISQVVQGVDIVFHQAAIRITKCAEDPRLALEVMVDGTFNILEAAAQAGVKKIIAASSASVYGLAEVFPTPEGHHLYNNRTLYGAAKGFNEALLRCFKEMYGIDYVALRYFNIYGPRMDISSGYKEVLILWMERIANGQPPIILGNGTQTMDFIYIEDVARANILAAQSDVTDQVFNIGSGVETSLNDLANDLIKVMKSNLRPEYGPERKVNPIPRRLADIAKAKQKLGFEAKISLSEGLSRLVDWWSSNK